MWPQYPQCAWCGEPFRGHYSNYGRYCSLRCKTKAEANQRYQAEVEASKPPLQTDEQKRLVRIVGLVGCALGAIAGVLWALLSGGRSPFNGEQVPLVGYVVSGGILGLFAGALLGLFLANIRSILILAGMVVLFLLLLGGMFLMFSQ